jgi:hypothetical protein
MKLIYVAILVLTTQIFYGQIEIKGKIIGQKSNEPLSFATIESPKHKTGTIADENGFFILNLPKGSSKSDTLSISFLGYNTSLLTIEAIQSNQIIGLDINDVLLKEVVVKPKKYKTKTFGITTKKPWKAQYANIFSGMLGNYIDNPKGKIGWISKVRFYIADEGYPTTPFRIRIFQKNPETGHPGDELLHKSVVVSATESGWLTCDISEYNIPFPEEGAFVVMEWINSGEQYYYQKKLPQRIKGTDQTQMTKRRFYGQALATVNRQPKMVLYGRGIGQEWFPYYFKNRGYINAMINVDVDFELK